MEPWHHLHTSSLLGERLSHGCPLRPHAGAHGVCCACMRCMPCGGLPRRLVTLQGKEEGVHQLRRWRRTW